MSLSIPHSKESLSSDSKLRCYTCLSLDRNLKLLNHEHKLLLIMLCPEMFFRAQPNTQYLICWECQSIISKIKRFQARLLKAHNRMKLTVRGVKTIVKGLSSLKIIAPETINITPPAPGIVETNQNQQIVIEISHPPMTPVPLKVESETIKIEIEEEEKFAGEISNDYDEVIQSTKILQASSDDSTDTASEVDMNDDPLMTPKPGKSKIIMECAKMAVPTQKPIKPVIIAPNVKFNYTPKQVFINVPQERLALRGQRETVKVTGGVPKFVTVKESVPTLVKRKSVSFGVKDEGSVPIAVKDEESVPIPARDERRVPMLIKGKGRVSVVVKGKGRSVPNRLTGKGRSIPNCVKGKLQTGPYNSNLRREPPPILPQSKEPEWEQTAGIYGYEEDEVKCIILNRTELDAYREKQRSKNGYKGHGYKCERCIERFMNQKNLDEHNKKHDKSQGDSVCALCEQRFPNDSYRDEHYKQHFIIYECLKCPYQNSDRLKITEHFRRNHEVSVFDCRKCDAVFNVRSTSRQIKMLVDYMSTHIQFAKGEYSGPLGREGQVQEWVRVQQMLQDYGPNKTVEQWRTTWRDLKKKARAEARVNTARAETSNHTPIDSLSENSIKILNVIGRKSVYGRAGQQETGLGEIVPQLPPPETSQLPPTSLPVTIFSSPPDTASSTNTNPGSVPILMPPSTPSTQQAAGQASARRQRARSLENDFLVSDADTRSILQDIKNCLDEKNKLTERKMRRSHLQRTHKEKRKHRIDVHSNRERQKCEECSKTFSTLALLKTHMATHERETTECTVCQKKVRNNYLHKHMKTHEDTGEDSAYCIDCKKLYKSQKSYNLHLRTSLRHNSVEKVGIKCDHCNKFFAGSTALKHHLEEVNGIRYTCDICKKDSKNKTVLARHIRFVHKGQRPQPKPKICEYCGKSFSIKKSLEQHINKHLGHRPLVCKDCGATFIYSAALFTHRRLVHKVKRRYEMLS